VDGDLSETLAFVLTKIKPQNLSFTKNMVSFTFSNKQFEFTFIQQNLVNTHAVMNAIVNVAQVTSDELRDCVYLQKASTTLDYSQDNYLAYTLT